MRAFSLALLPLLCLSRPGWSTQLDYTVYVLGVPALEAGMTLDLAPASYRAAMEFHTIGLAAVAFRGRQEQHAQGGFANGRPVPLEYGAAGAWRGQERSARLTYRDEVPTVAALLPLRDVEREPVPSALLTGTLDPLSVMVGLLRVVADTGRCDGTARGFDGRRVVAYRATTMGEEVLVPSSRSVFSGRALRCDIVNEVLAGFRTGEDRASDAGPRRATIWLAPVLPGARSLPVRVSAETRLVGDAMIYLTRATP